MRQIFKWLFSLCVSFLAACGGGGGGGGGGVAALSSITLQGVAATGAAISGGTVDVKCKNGTGTATTNADGTYTVTVVDGAQPCILRAVDPVTKIQLFSIVEAGGTTANITPVTSLVVANTLGDSPSTSFASFSSAVHEKITVTSISAAVKLIQAATAAIGADADMTGIDIMKGALTAATDSVVGNDADKKIDALMAALSAADKRITDLTDQLKSAATANAAASVLSAVVGESKYSLANCLYARSGDVWAIDFLGTAPIAFNVDYNNMVLKDLRDNSTSAISPKRDSSNNAIPCAFTSTISGNATEFRISEGGIAVWSQLNNFGFGVPMQKTKLLTDTSFAGTYPSLAFIREKTLGYRTATPIRFEVDSNGGMNAYSCDMTKTKPDCLTGTVASSADPTSCVQQSNGTFACTSTAGLVATGILYVAGSQATMFMSIINMSVGVYRFGGLLVMTKASKISLPTVGVPSSWKDSWYTAISSGGNNVESGTTISSTVQSVDLVNNKFTTSVSGSNTFTRYIDTPTNGFIFSDSTSSKGVTLRSPSGWSVAINKGSGEEFDSWSALIRPKR